MWDYEQRHEKAPYDMLLNTPKGEPVRPTLRICSGCSISSFVVSHLRRSEVGDEFAVFSDFGFRHVDIHFSALGH